MEQNDKESKNKGFTVSELESTFKKYVSEIGFIVIFVVTAIFTLVWGGAMVVWSILLCMAFAIVGVVLPESMNSVVKKALDFVYKEKIILIVTGVVLVILAVFIPVLIFALIGLLAGSSLCSSMKKKSLSHIFSSKKEMGEEKNEDQTDNTKDSE